MVVPRVYSGNNVCALRLSIHERELLSPDVSALLKTFASELSPPKNEALRYSIKFVGVFD